MIVTIVALAVLAGAGAWIALRSNPFRATAQVLVTPAAFDDSTYAGLSIVRDTSADPTRGIQTAAAMLDSPVAAAMTAQTLGSEWTQARVRAAVTLTPIGGANVIAVQVSAAQAVLAARIADTFARAALDEHSRVLRGQASTLVAHLTSVPQPPPPAQLDHLLAVSQGFDPSFSLLHAAAVPGSPATPAVWRLLSMMLFAGLILGIAVALLIDRVGDRSSGEAEVVELAVRKVSSPKVAPRG